MKKIIMCLVIVSLAMLTGCSESKSEDFYFKRAQMHFDNLEAYLNEDYQYCGTTVKVPHKREDFTRLEFEKKKNCCYISGMFSVEYTVVKHTCFFKDWKANHEFIICVNDDGSAKFTSIKGDQNDSDWLKEYRRDGFDNYLHAEQ